MSCGSWHLAACLFLVARLEQVGVDGVGDARHALSAQQGAMPGLLFQPPAARHEADVPVLVQLLFLAEGAVCEVSFASSSADEGAVAAFLSVVGALAGMVADARAWPHVVHGPHHGLARSQNLVDILQGEHTLIYPVQMDDVGLPEFGQRGDVRARIGYVDGKEIGFLEAVGPPDDDAFPNEFPHRVAVVPQRHHRNPVGLLVAHQQLGFYSVFF